MVKSRMNPNSTALQNECEWDIIPEFISLQQHFARLTKFLIECTPPPKEVHQQIWNHYAGQDYWLGVSNPLFIAASINSIETNIAILDDAAFWCEPAFEYDLAISQLTSQYVQEASRFMWSWISFEQVIDKLCIDYEEKTRTAKAIRYLSEAPEFRMSGAVKSLFNLLKEISSEDILQGAISAARRSDSLELFHVHLCREVRNSMLHSAVKDVEPEDYDDIDSYDAKNEDRVVGLRVASRLTLLTIQSMLGVYLHQSPAKIDAEDEDTFAGVELWRVIQCIHLTDQSVEKINLLGSRGQIFDL